MFLCQDTQFEWNLRNLIVTPQIKISQMMFTQVICSWVLFYFLSVFCFFTKRPLTLPNSKFFFKYIENLGLEKYYFLSFFIYVFYFHLRLVTFYIFRLKITLWSLIIKLIPLWKPVNQETSNSKPANLQIKDG